MWAIAVKQKLWKIRLISNVAKNDFFAKHLNMQVDLLLLQKLVFFGTLQYKKK